MPLDDAQHALDDAMRRAIGDRDTPRLTAIRITAGGGKSTAALMQLGVEKRYNENIGMGFSADYYVPTHKLGDELAAKAETHGLNAVVEKGRKQEVDGVPVCFKWEAAEQLHGVVSDVAAKICGSDDAGFCPAYERCTWRDIKAESGLAPDVEITPDMDDEQSLKTATEYDRQ